MLRIRAVGTVTSNVYENGDDVFCVNVDYNNPNYDFDGIIEDRHINDGMQRNKRIYQETNRELVHIINELLHE